MAEPTPSAASRLRLFYLLLAATAVLGLGIVGWVAVDPRVAASQSRAVPAADSAVGISVGRADAPVVVHEFADFQCVHCARVATEVVPAIERGLVAQGKVRLVHVDLPLSIHPHAFRAARAARCANDQGRYTAYRAELFGRQREWAPRADATPAFAEAARRVGLDGARFDACLASDRHAEQVARDMAYAASAGVGGTPTVAVNGRVLEVRQLRSAAALEGALREAAAR